MPVYARPTQKTGGQDIIMADPLAREMIVDEALSWVGTPYQHQCSHKFEGCDCLGLVRGVWRHLYGDEPETLSPYSPDWAEKSSSETLLEAAGRWLIPRPVEMYKPADILVFRMQPGVAAKHMAIVSKPDEIVHAYWGRAVTRSFFAPFWSRRLVAVFSFPDVRD